jgi:vacuolar-type H+-ATPase subunit I/STV1
MVDYNSIKSIEEFSASDIFKNISAEKLEPIKESIEEIELMIKHRASVHKEINEHVGKVQIDIDNTLLEMPKLNSTATLGSNLGGELVKAISELKKKKLELEELKIAEKLNFWRDVADLKKELREYVREFKEKESKSDLLDSLL